MGSCSFCASQEVLPYYYNGTSTVLLEDQLYHWKTNCCVGRSTVLLEIDCIIGRFIAMPEDEWKIKGTIRKSAVLKTINWIRWKLPIKENKLQEDDYISMSEQNAVHLASPDTYIKCAIQTFVRPSICSAYRVRSVTSTVLDGFFPY